MSRLYTAVNNGREKTCAVCTRSSLLTAQNLNFSGIQTPGHLGRCDLIHVCGQTFSTLGGGHVERHKICPLLILIDFKFPRPLNFVMCAHNIQLLIFFVAIQVKNCIFRRKGLIFSIQNFSKWPGPTWRHDFSTFLPQDPSLLPLTRPTSIKCD